MFVVSRVSARYRHPGRNSSEFDSVYSSNDFARANNGDKLRKSAAYVEAQAAKAHEDAIVELDASDLEWLEECRDRATIGLRVDGCAGWGDLSGCEVRHRRCGDVHNERNALSFLR